MHYDAHTGGKSGVRSVPQGGWDLVPFLMRIGGPYWEQDLTYEYLSHLGWSFLDIPGENVRGSELVEESLSKCN